MVDRRRSDILVDHARQTFDCNISIGEEAVLRDAAIAIPLASTDPRSLRRPIRATLVRWLVTDQVNVRDFGSDGIIVVSAHIIGTLDLAGCRLESNLAFDDCLFEETATFTNAKVDALQFRKVTLARGLAMFGIRARDGLILQDVEAFGGIHASRAQFGSLFLMDLRSESMDYSLNLSSVRVDGPVDIIGASLVGTLSADDLKVDGTVYTERLAIDAPKGALKLDDARIRGSVHLTGLTCNGPIRMAAARIDGHLYLAGGTISVESSNDPALYLANLQVGAGAYLDGTAITGSINMTRITTQESLRFRAAVVRGKQNYVLLDGASIGGSLHLEGANFEGPLLIEGASILGNVRCDAMTVKAFYGDGVEIRGSLYWVGIRNPEETELALDRAIMGELRDDQASWPTNGKLSITAIQLHRLTLVGDLTWDAAGLPHSTSERPFRAEERIQWLERQRESSIADPRQWTLIANMLKADGNEAGGKRVLYSLRRHQAIAERNRVTRLLKKCVAILEKSPTSILLPLIGFLLFGSMVFWALRAHFAPTGAEAYKAASSARLRAYDVPAYPTFSPFLYSLENELPGLRLGQDDKWAPDVRLGNRGVYWFLVSTRVLLIISGWTQGVVLVAALSARFQK